MQRGRAPWRPSPPGTLLGQDSPRFPAAHPAEIAEWRETEATVNAAVVQEGVGGVMKALQGSFEGLFQVSGPGTPQPHRRHCDSRGGPGCTDGQALGSQVLPPVGSHNKERSSNNVQQESSIAVAPTSAISETKARVPQKTSMRRQVQRQPRRCAFGGDPVWTTPPILGASGP